MIPKILHHIWLSDKPCPDTFKKWTDTWSKIMPEYDIKYTTLDNIRITEGLQRFLDNKEQPNAAVCYAKCQLLKEFGGIVLDLDIEVIKSFDDLLHMDFIAGHEDPIHLCNAVMGCEKDNPVIDKMIEYMDSIPMDTPQLPNETGPRLLTKMKHMIKEPLRESYFYPFHYTQDFTKECIKPETHTIHWWAGSWTDKPKIDIWK